MATGVTITGSLAEALPDVLAEVRIKKEYVGVWRRTCDVKKQKPNTGLSWTEFALNQLAGQDITETAENRNFQQLSGTLLSIEPTMSQIIIKVTDRTYRKIAAMVKDKMGGLAGNAMSRKEDEDYLAIFSTFDTTNSPGAGNPLSFGHISSAKTNITSNVTEPSMAEVFTVLHGRQIKDIQDEVLAGVGTYTVPEGLTAETFRKGFSGTVAGSNLFEDGNITVDSGPNANGATHSREGVVAAIGMEITTKTDYDLYFGGGAGVISLTNEYAFVERMSGTAGTTQVWCYLHRGDAAPPTS